MKKLFTIVITILFSSTLFAQTVVTGNIKDAALGDPLPGVNIKVVGKSLGTSTDFDGNYTLKVSQELPFDIEFTNLGYKKQTVTITSANQTVDISLEENASALDEVVVSASRTPESVRESPVTIERMDARDIKNASTASFYNSIENLKGVDVNTSSLTFNSVNTRGFATFANTRFVQLVDGMDNSSPALNFVMGNLVGMNELDVNSIELLPGASSALYGANAFNGILFMTSKNPFEHQGISVYGKKGITSSQAGGDDAYTDVGIRAAHAFNDKFAAKVSFSYLDGTDWVANDTRQYELTQPGYADTISDFRSSPTHDGINIYGDEVSLAANGTNLREVGQSLEAMMLIPAGSSNVLPMANVARDGYLEQQLTDYQARSVKTDVSLNYRPSGDDLEIVWNTRIGFGNSIYQGANRYQLDGFLMQQHKIEVRNDNFFVRGYTTAETAGDSYDLRFTGINLAKVDATEWFGTYAGAYLQSFTNFADNDQAHANARIAANAAYPLLVPGTPRFETEFNRITNDPDVNSGSKFVDNTKLYVGEGNYNFSHLLNDAVDLQVGGNYRKYSLNSQGTIFTDYDGPINYDEFGAYVQAVKKFADDRLKVSASLRMDKNEFFDASISPRVSLNYAAGESKQHNFRASFQTGFRNPDTQSLFIGFDVGRAILVGSSPDNLDRDLPGTTLTARDAYQDSYTLTSATNFGEAVEDAIPSIIAANPGISVEQAAVIAGVQNIGILEVANVGLVEQEKVTAFDVGYRGKIKNFSIDLNAYYNLYDGFINNQITVAPITGTTSDLTTFSGVADLLGGNTQVFQTYTNSTADISSYGGVVGLSTRLSGYKFGVNYTYSKLEFNQADEPDFSAQFNTPEHKVKFSVGNTNVYKNIGFNVNARWSDQYFWESSIANAVVDERTVVDAIISYSVPKWKSQFKIGGTNLGGDDYRSAPAAGNIGSQYFISWTINN